MVIFSPKADPHAKENGLWLARKDSEETDRQCIVKTLDGDMIRPSDAKAIDKVVRIEWIIGDTLPSEVFLEPLEKYFPTIRYAHGNFKSE